ncbi:MAG TPA: coproporphyrinogen-III oxidase family protein [Bradyrhizobium sp.]|nr:coproporphyrinogen-III oxidase family protein [Bradyrhizobium sp.]
MTYVDDVLARVDTQFGNYDWERLDRAGFNKKNDYCFIFSYPPVRTLQPIEEEKLFLPSEHGSLDEPCSLYIHIPYCTGICSYCYFAKVLDNDRAPVLRSAYPAMLQFELERILERTGADPVITSVHFGGGTPSTLSVTELRDVMSMVHGLRLAPDAEVTLECAPETIEREPDKLLAMREYGINRLNLGVESLDDEVLRIMGRRHRSAETLRVLDLMFEAGFDNINVDLIYDLPGQSLTSWIETLSCLEQRGVHSISTYRLRKHPMKKISKMEPALYPAYEDGLRMQIAHSLIMEDAGFVRSSSHKYARGEQKLQRQVERKRGVEQNQLISLGCGAYGFMNGTFYWNTKSLSEYGHAVQNRQLPVWIGQVLDKQELMRKTMVMGMHTNKGVSINGFLERYGESPLEVFSQTIGDLEELGLFEVAEGYLRPTAQGRFFSDEISVAFYSPAVRQALHGVGMKYGMFFENDKYA